MAEKQENVPSNVFGGNDVAEQLKLTGKRISEARKALGISIREMVFCTTFLNRNIFSMKMVRRTHPFLFC